jgi:hypothetical protein
MSTTLRTCALTTTIARLQHDTAETKGYVQGAVDTVVGGELSCSQWQMQQDVLKMLHTVVR